MSEYKYKEYIFKTLKFPRGTKCKRMLKYIVIRKTRECRTDLRQRNEKFAENEEDHGWKDCLKIELNEEDHGWKDCLKIELNEEDHGWKDCLKIELKVEEEDIGEKRPTTWSNESSHTAD